MALLATPPISGIIRRRERADLSERWLRRSLERGQLIRIAPGSFAHKQAWDAATHAQRHAQRVWEASLRLEPGTVFATFAAAAILGSDVLGPWPTTIDVVTGPSAGGRSTGLVRRHVRRSQRLDVVPWGDHFVTTPAQTALDLAAATSFANGVAAVDQALWRRRPGGRLLTLDELHDRSDAYDGRGRARAQRAAAFAAEDAANVRESQSRVLIDQLGFPRPSLQQRLVLPSGRVVYTDFWWREHLTAGELDGMVKYTDETILAGRTAREALSDEKDREDELRRVVSRVARWRVRALDDPRELWDILVQAGLPTSRRRPSP